MISKAGCMYVFFSINEKPRKGTTSYLFAQMREEYFALEFRKPSVF